MGVPTSLDGRWEGGFLTVHIRPAGPAPAASVAAASTLGSAGAFAVALALHALGLEGLAVAALVGVPLVPILVLAGLPALLDRWRARAIEVVVRSPELRLGSRRVHLERLVGSRPVLRSTGYALQLETRDGVVELPLGGHDLDAVRWLQAAVERQRRAYHTLTDTHRGALERLEALRGPPRR